ncbi:hypothetical protein FHS27_003728 [Rhodopirellula rubra]|uniref:Peptidase M50 domain-containing protein n=1 Tax=Aporhodopirellula rubra TaxID=980271 RepID=A0A7W5E0G7_9BACT|nr:site-2 protease family protein [Aporhodopirellula rubra]MBB3207901.1 hypothetical protein [Aporhodopirellula rubra]
MREPTGSDSQTSRDVTANNESEPFFAKAGWSVLPDAAPEKDNRASPNPDSVPNDSSASRVAETNATAEATPQPVPASPTMIQIDPDVEFTPIEIAGISMARCVHAGTGVHFQFGAAEYHVAMMLDGTRSVTEIVQQLSDDGLDWTPQDVADFIGVLVAQKIAITQSPAADPTVETPSIERALASESQPSSVETLFDKEQTEPRQQRPSPEGATEAKSRVAALFASLVTWCSYVISLRLPLLHAAPWAKRVTPIVRPLLGGYVRVLACVGIVVSMLFAASQHSRLSGELLRIFDSNQWLVMIGAWMVLKVIHETGHACTACHYGVRVGRAGVMFFLFAPLAYVDVTDAWKLPQRRSRVAIALGGVYFELICASIALWVWWLFPGGVIAHVAAQVFFLAGPATLLVNANPLLRLDGYYVVSDLVDIPNLREQGRKLLGGRIEHRLFGLVPAASHLSGWRSGFATLHAAASIVFQFVWMGGLVIVVSMWAGPLGLLVAACALMLWAVIPATRWCYRIWTYTGSGESFSRGSHRRRIAWVALTIMTIGQFFLALPSPLIVEVPVVARFSGEEVLRSPVSGFVRHVYWNTGEFVRAGQVVMQIENEEIEVQRDEIQFQLEAEAIKWQRNEHSELLGLAEASTQRSESLRRKLVELDEQVASLKVKATRDGEILTPLIHQLNDQFVSVGDELTRIGNRSHKELLLSIGEEEMNAYREAFVKQQPLRVCFRGGQWLDIIPTEMRPRGSVTVSHPALAASAGGPVPVVPNTAARQGAPTVEWISPRFEAIIELPPSKADAVRCGEVGYLALQDKRSLARRFWIWLGGS